MIEEIKLIKKGKVIRLLVNRLEVSGQGEQATHPDKTNPCHSPETMTRDPIETRNWKPETGEL